MQSATFDLPEAILLDIPRDYARNVAFAPVRILEEASESGLLIRWGDAEIAFVSRDGGCSYERQRISFTYGRRRIMGWHICELLVEVGDSGYLPILYAEEKDETLLRGVIDQMLRKNVPLQPFHEESRTRL
jgi:hypothetical protein